MAKLVETGRARHWSKPDLIGPKTRSLIDSVRQRRQGSGTQAVESIVGAATVSSVDELIVIFLEDLVRIGKALKTLENAPVPQ